MSRHAPFCWRLRRLIDRLQRANERVTQSYVARACGVSPRTLEAWLSGSRVPHKLIQLGVMHLLYARRGKRSVGTLGRGRGGRGKPRSTRYAGVDWRQSDRQIAETVGASRQAVSAWRKKWVTPS